METKKNKISYSKLEQGFSIDVSTIPDSMDLKEAIQECSENHECSIENWSKKDMIKFAKFAKDYKSGRDVEKAFDKWIEG